MNILSLLFFLILYIVFLIPVYFPGIDFLLADALGMSAEESTEALWLESIFYIPLIIIAFIRGQSQGKTWIGAFVIVAWLFDEVIAFVPFAPTIFHIITIILGIIPRSK